MHRGTADATFLSAGLTCPRRASTVLATEHWSLLATRSITYGAIFNRASIFLTVVSAALVALALVAEATEFGVGLPEAR